MKLQFGKRTLSVLLALAMLLSFAIPARSATPQEELQELPFAETQGCAGVVAEDSVYQEEETPALYAPEDVVRVSIVLDSPSTLEAGYSTLDIAGDSRAMAYRETQKTRQADLTASIEAALSKELDVVWNLTLAANLISANVAYGDLETIAGVEGVAQVILEPQYDPCVVEQEEVSSPNAATSANQIGAAGAYAAGYTGAGSRVAIIDTGIDVDHQSFSEAGYLHALSLLAEEADMTTEDYIDALDILDAQEIDGLLGQLNVADRSKDVTGADLFKTQKIAFGYNYVDEVVDYIDHDQDAQGGHGSHVAGIAVANRYIPRTDGGFAPALETVHTQGVAPDAQLLVMKVFGILGGAYTSDFMAAIEDAIILGCDSVNLSLGSTVAGFSNHPTYEELLNSLADSDTVVTISAGNRGAWFDGLSTDSQLYTDDVGTHTGGIPGTYTNSFCVASVDNSGSVGYYLTVGDENIIYTESAYSNLPLRTLAGKQEYIFIDGIGTDAEFAALESVLEGRIAICSRGNTSFFQKAEAAVAHGAIATIIYNNAAGSINMDLTDYTGTAPCVSITQAQGAAIRALSTPAALNGMDYFTGSMTISGSEGFFTSEESVTVMSDFSSWGVPGSLEMKPEIAAPGGSIYSVDGTVDGGAAYTTMSGTSMAAPQTAGMAALVAQYIRANGLDEAAGLTRRALTQSLLMSTAKPLKTQEGAYYPILQQGAGLGNVGDAIAAHSYILMDETAASGAADGKVKVELKDDPNRTGLYTFGFTIHNMEDVAQQYMLSADFFAQDWYTDGTYTYMDRATTPMEATVTWTVNGQTLTPAGDVSGYDFNGDGVVNTGDVQPLVDYAAGLSVELNNAHLADISGDGIISTYDGYLLLQGLNQGLVTLEPQGEVQISVTVTLTENQKQYLDTHFENGTYVQGFVYARQLSSAEGVEGTEHSIPVLGFYGNWSDASMYEQGSYAERVYDLAKPFYLTYSAQSHNSFILRYPDKMTQYHSGNPYGIEESYPAGREAINIRTSLYRLPLGVIRDAAAVFMVVKNQDGEYLYIDSPTYQMNAGFNYNGGWYNTHYVYELNRSPVAVGAEEGDRITASLVAVPELYIDSYDLTREDLIELLESGVLGDGAYLTSSFTVDSKAPELLRVYKDLQTGDLVVEVRDDNHVAAVQVQGAGGRVYATAMPGDSEKGETVQITIDMSEAGNKVGQECVLVVGDYAKNETAYVLDYGGESEDYTGQVFGFTKSEVRGSGKRWIRLTPDELWYGSDTPEGQGGLENVEQTDLDVMAAEYVNGYVFMAAADGYFYVGKQGTWDEYICAGSYSQTTETILDMAYNYANDTLYALDAANTIWSVDIYSLELTQVATVTIVNPATVASANAKLSMMTIDDDGNFYAVNYGTDTNSFLYRFTLDQVENGAITDLTPVVNDKANTAGYYTYYGSLAWDHDEDILYMATSSLEEGLAYGYMAIFDTQTGKAYNVNDKVWIEDYQYAARLFLTVRGLYVVPKGDPAAPITMTDETRSIELNRTSAKALVGNEFSILARAYPWNRNDTGITWSSSDTSVAEVNQRGDVTLVGIGTATITATTNSKPNLSATCQVTAEEIPDFTLDALVYDASEKAQWARFSVVDPDNWQAVSDKSDYYDAGTSLNGYIYAHDNDNVYRIDPVTFETTQTMALTLSRRWSDAAPAPLLDGAFGRLAVVYNYGKYAGLVDPETGTISQFNTMAYMKGADSLATIAYVGSGTYDYQSYTDRPAHFYYILDEAGTLWSAVMVNISGNTYRLVSEALGSTGLTLPLVSYISSDLTAQRASMVYDPESGYLFVSSYQDGEEARLYAIQPESLLTTDLGSFGINVWPVVALHEPMGAGTDGAEIPQHFYELQGESIESTEISLSDLETMAAENQAVSTPRPAADTDQQADCDAGTNTLILTADDQSTNGIIVVDYDESALTLESLEVYAQFQTVIQEEGRVTLAYVNETPLTEVARLTFSMTEDSMVVVVTKEENQLLSDIQNAILLFPPEHDYALTRTQKPTCTEAGSQTWTCVNCGHHYDETLAATGHEYQAIVTPPTCAEGGYTTYLCHCGDSYIADETDPFCPSSIYTDVSMDDWFHEAVDFVTEAGLMEGIGDQRFAPNATATRAQIITVLYRMEGSPEVTAVTAFTDVPADAWYAQAVAWALSNGITNGVSEDRFAPDQALTREQMVTCLYRYASYKGLDTDIRGDLGAFTDRDKISTWALDAFAWAVENEIVSGMGNGTLAPRSVATRAQIATVLRNFCQMN